MSAYSVNQEIKELLWGTPMPIIANLNSNTVMLHIKGSCSLIVGDADLLQEKLPDTDNLVTQVRSTLVLAAVEAITNMGKRVSSIEQLTKFAPEFSQLIKMKAMDGLAGFGLKIKQLDIHAVEDGGPPPAGL